METTLQEDFDAIIVANKELSLQLRGKQAELEMCRANKNALELALSASQAREARLREALEPFAACAEVWKKSEKEQVIHVSRRNVRGKDDLVLHVSDLLNAAAALRDTAQG